MTTKEELDEAIAHLAGVFIPDSGAVETALTIITKYRDGQLVEKSNIRICQKCNGKGGFEYKNDHRTAIIPCDNCNHTGFITTPPTNQTDKP